MAAPAVFMGGMTVDPWSSQARQVGFFACCRPMHPQRSRPRRACRVFTALSSYESLVA